MDFKNTSEIPFDMFDCHLSYYVSFSVFFFFLLILLLYIGEFQAPAVRLSNRERETEPEGSDVNAT